VLLVLDAAYADYVSRNDYELGIELVATTENTVHDAYVLKDPRAGVACGIGWMFGPANIVDAVNRIPRPLQRLDALRCWRRWRQSRTPRMSRCRRRLPEHWRNWLTEEISKLGLR
jgi:histidinol-phosphate aminotransferase